MAGLRKSCCYRKIERPYTRKSKYKKKGYIKAIPPHKIARFEMGNKERLKADYAVKMCAVGNLQIRSNALESCRLLILRNFEEKAPNGYFLRLNVFPHHAIRENKMLGGAHADRLQTGMAHSFGKVIGTVAQVRDGTAVFIAWVDKDKIDIAKLSLQKGASKLPCSVKIKIEENRNKA